MRPFSFLSPFIFVPMVVLWLYIRHWPWGDLSQTGMDVLLVLIALLVWNKNKKQ